MKIGSKFALIEDTLPLMLAPVSQLGLQVAFGLRGVPSNRIMMCYGPPSGGKSSLFFLLSGEYTRNGDEVWFEETERALDRIYMASYIPSELKGSDLAIEALKYFEKRTSTVLAKEAKTKEDDKAIGPNHLEKMQERITAINTLVKELKAGTPKEQSQIPLSLYRNLLRTAIAEYKLRDIIIDHPSTLEEFESRTLEKIEEKQKDPKRRFKRLLIGVDSLSYLLPKEDLEKAVSSDGRGLMTAKYLHMLLPRLLGRIAGSEISMFFVVQQTTHIKMNPYESTSKVGSVQGRGGTALKFGATFMMGVEQRAAIKNVGGEDVKTGIVSIPKSKLRGGGQGPTDGRFYLKEGVESSLMNFNEPLVLEILNEGQMGIKKKRAFHYVPASLLQTHPRFKEDILPKLKPFPKGKDEEDDDDVAPPAVEAAQSEEGAENAEEKGKSIANLYYMGYAAEVMPLLLQSPTFVEEVLAFYDVVEPV